MRHLSLVGRRLIVNQVLAYTLWFPVRVWAGMWKTIRSIKGILRDYLWEGQLGHTRAIVHGHIDVPS